jgi:hypothetical protein
MVQRSLAALIKQIETDLDAVRDEFLTNVAEDLVSSSPVDTGTYVKNHSITTSTGSGGRQSSAGKPKDNGSARGEALDKLIGQIVGIPKGTETVYIANRSPHANIVEYVGWENKNTGKVTSPYYVYEGVRNRANLHLQEAIQTVKARQ